MEFTEREQKFIRLMLDASALGGEQTTTVTKLIESLRSRGIKADDLLKPTVSNHSNAYNNIFNRSYNQADRLEIIRLKQQIRQLDSAINTAKSRQYDAEKNVEAFKALAKTHQSASERQAIELTALRNQVKILQDKLVNPNASNTPTIVGNHIFTFGQHAGRTINQVPRHYLDYINHLDVPPNKVPAYTFTKTQDAVRQYMRERSFPLD